MFHSIEPIPESDKDSTGPQADVDLGRRQHRPDQLGARRASASCSSLGLWGDHPRSSCWATWWAGAIFSAFTVVGHKTGVNQMVLSRSAFGRRGRLPAEGALMFLMTLGWIGVNTYFPVKIAVAILGQFRDPRHVADQLRGRDGGDGDPGADRHLRVLRDPHLREVQPSRSRW